MEIGRYVRLVMVLSSAVNASPIEVIDDVSIIRHGGVTNAFFLSCEAGYVMSFINVTSGRNQGCYGETPSLIIQKHDCYWRQNCTLQLPRDEIVKVNGPDDIDCLGQVPDFLRAFGLRCFKTSDEYGLVDICDHKEIGYKGAIMRSHSTYPWDYEFEEKSCQLTLYKRVANRLIFTVQEADLGEFDILRMRNGSSHTDLAGYEGERSLELDMENADTVVDFTVDKQSNGGKGFLLCYKSVHWGETETNACDAVTMHGKVDTKMITVPDPLMILIDIVNSRIPGTTPAPEPEQPCRRRKKNKKCKKPRKERCRGKKRRKDKDGKCRRKNRKQAAN